MKTSKCCFIGSEFCRRFHAIDISKALVYFGVLKHRLFGTKNIRLCMAVRPLKLSLSFSCSPCSPLLPFLFFHSYYYNLLHNQPSHCRTTQSEIWPKPVVNTTNNNHIGNCIKSHLQIQEESPRLESECRSFTMILALDHVDICNITHLFAIL